MHTAHAAAQHYSLLGDVLGCQAAAEAPRVLLPLPGGHRLRGCKPAHGSLLRLQVGQGGAPHVHIQIPLAAGPACSCLGAWPAVKRPEIWPAVEPLGAQPALKGWLACKGADEP